MTATETLHEARAAGIDIRVDGCDLVLEAHAPPRPDLLARLAECKQGIITLLRPGLRGWSVEAWREYFDERAGVAEFDGGLTRREAEMRALESCVDERINRTLEGAPPGLCIACGGAAQEHEVMVPHVVQATAEIRFHRRCWPSWRASRTVEVVAALKEMCIGTLEFPDDFGKAGGT